MTGADDGGCGCQVERFLVSLVQRPGELSFGQKIAMQGGRLDGWHGHDHREPHRRQATIDFLSQGVGQHVLNSRHEDVSHLIIRSALLDEGHRGIDPAGQVWEKNLVLARKVVEECLRGNPCGVAISATVVWS